MPAGLARFQEAIGAEFPTLLVPNAQAGQAPALQPFRFVSGDGNEVVSVALNLFSFTTKRYGVFAQFQDRFDALFSRFRKIHAPEELTRAGLRYVNVLPWLDTGLARPHPWLKLEIGAPKILRRSMPLFATSMVLEYPAGRLRVQAGRAQEQPAGPGVAARFTLDFDFSREGPFPVTDLPSFLDLGHTTVEDAFFGLLTPEALRRLEGRS